MEIICDTAIVVVCDCVPVSNLACALYDGGKMKVEWEKSDNLYGLYVDGKLAASFAKSTYQHSITFIILLFNVGDTFERIEKNDTSVKDVKDYIMSRLGINEQEEQ